MSSFDNRNDVRRREMAWDAMRDGNFDWALAHLDPGLSLLRKHHTERDTASSSSSNGLRLVENLQFFESGQDEIDLGNRTYKTRFLQSSTRYVCAELLLNNMTLVTDYQCDITVRYKKPDGTLLHTVRDSRRVSRQSRTFTHTVGCGWSDAGRWDVGTYSVDVYVNDRLAIQEQFAILAFPRVNLFPFGQIWR